MCGRKRRYTPVSQPLACCIVIHSSPTVDDSTGVIDCILRHLGPLAHLDSNARAAYWSSAQRHVPIPVRAPPLPATAIGYPVEVIGKVLEFHGQRRISAKSISTSYLYL